MKNKILKLIAEIEELLKNKPHISDSEMQSTIKGATDRFNFKVLKSSNYYRTLSKRIEVLREVIYETGADYRKNKGKEKLFLELFNLSNSMDAENIEQQVDKIKAIINQLSFTRATQSGPLKINFPVNTPQDIKEEVMLDIKELSNAFNAGCYRATIILCGRVLETCLHRKYYEATNNDLLEKAPGIGLGNLIAKMRDKGIELDPGLMQQVHLLNNVRIFSVHKKKQMFLPSKQQTYAMILYTMDVISRLF